MTRLRKAYYVKPGSFHNLRIEEENIPPPGNSEVQIEVKSIGLNFADVFCIIGLYKAAPKTDFVPGLEFAGIVSKVGSEVKGVKTGDQVMGVCRFGAYATILNIDYNYVIRLPSHWNYAEGSAYLVQVLTAYYGLKELGSIRPSQKVLIHSAAGGVGIWANRICKYFDCFTIGTVGSQHKLKLLAREGYDASIVRSSRTFTSQLSEVLDGDQVDLVMESIGGKIFQDSYKALAPMGRMITYGSSHYGDNTDKPNYLKLIWKYINRPKIDPQNMISENKSIMAFNLIFLFRHVEIMHRLLSELSEMNLGKPIIDNSYAFTELPKALKDFQSGKTMGKLIISIDKI